MNEAIRIAEKMLTEADELMNRAKKLIEYEEEAKKRKRRDEMDALNSLVNSISPRITPEYIEQKMGFVTGGYITPALVHPLTFGPCNLFAPKVPNPEQKTVEVKRHAKVGETIKIANPQHDWNCTVKDYNFGDTFTVTESTSTQGVRITSKRQKPCFIRDSEYVVVKPVQIKPEVGMWIKRGGKMFCIISMSTRNEDHFYVADTNSIATQAAYADKKISQKWRYVCDGEYAIVPNYAPTPADMLEVIQ